MKHGNTHYTANAGIYELREAISDRLDTLYGVRYDPDSEIIVTVGASEALYLAACTILNPGDEMIVVTPCFVSYQASVELANGVAVEVPCRLEDNFDLNVQAIEDAITPKTRGILLGFPNNPTGAVASREKLQQVADLAARHDLAVISDEIYDYLSIARAYEAAGAEAVSCLTEPKWFLGSDRIFREIRAELRTPMLRKDFVVDEYQLYQARAMGADCVLLICALLDTDTMARWLGLCEDLGLAALTEAHDEREIASAVSAGARMIGVNNRNLKDFTVDLGNAARLRENIPPGCLYVAESGVKTPADAAALKAAGADAILLGETLMRAGDKGALLAAMREAAG